MLLVSPNHILQATSRIAGMVVLLWIAGCVDSVPTTGSPATSPAARRIVTLSPHLAELVYAAGAGAYLVGASDFTDFPAEAAQVPRVGDAFRPTPMDRGPRSRHRRACGQRRRPPMP